MATLLSRLLPLLLLLPPPLRDYYISSSSSSSSSSQQQQHLHPLILVPGASCPYVEARLTESYRPPVPRCGAMVGKPWFALWENASDVPAHDYLACFQDQMRLVYDPAANAYRNPPGVQTRIPNFGSASGFGDKKPLNSEFCLTVLREALESKGYVDGHTLFGAPYDLRYAPPSPGQSPEEVYAAYFEQMTRLVENATTTTGANKKKKKKKAILFGHSFGGLVALEFVRSKSPAWRRKYVKHLVLVAPTVPAHGFVEALRNLVEGTDMVFVPGATPLSLRPLWRTFETALVNLPSPATFSGDDGRLLPLVVTARRNYSASAEDMEELMAGALGFAAGVEPFRRTRDAGDGFRAPMVPVTCVNGVGRRTPRRPVYWEGDFDRPADEVVYGDGDGKVNLDSMLAFDDEMRRDPGQRRWFRSVKVHGAGHSDIVTVESTLKKVLREIQEANNAVGFPHRK